MSCEPCGHLGQRLVGHRSAQVPQRLMHARRNLGIRHMRPVLRQEFADDRLASLVRPPGSLAG